MKAKWKILVVDDELPLAMMMVALLTRAGFEVEAACSLEKALRKVETQRFDLITLDFEMPGGDGLQLLEKLKQNPCTKEIRVVFVSGHSTVENQERTIRLGAIEFIGKPFDPTQFVSRIRKHLEQATTENRKNKCPQ